MTPEDNKYAKSHEYVHVEGQIGTVGITDYAQKELGDVVFVELPQVGTQLEAGDELGSIESVKAVSELFAPVSGEVVDITEMLAAIGVDSVDRLFDSIPKDVKLERLLDIPGPWSEIESRRWFRETAARNKTAVDHLSFLGGGAYAHSQPACVDQLLLRAE